MQEISFFLEKYKKFAPPDDTVRTEFARSVKKVLGIDVPKENISLKNGTIYAKVQPALKSELFMKRKEILTEMSAALSVKAPQNIR